MNIYEIKDGRAVMAELQAMPPIQLRSTFRLPVGRGTSSEGLHLRISMPAVLDHDFTFGVGARALALSGIRREPEGFGEWGSTKYGLAYGHFRQRILLPAGLDVEKLDGRLHHGVLDIFIPYLLRPVPVAVPLVTEVWESFTPAMA